MRTTYAPVGVGVLYLAHASSDLIGEHDERVDVDGDGHEDDGEYLRRTGGRGEGNKTTEKKNGKKEEEEDGEEKSGNKTCMRAKHSACIGWRRSEDEV